MCGNNVYILILPGEAGEALKILVVTTSLEDFKAISEKHRKPSVLNGKTI